MKKLKLLSYSLLFSVIVSIIFLLFGLISFIGGVTTEYYLYFEYKNYKKKDIYISEIISSNCGKGGSFSITGKSKNYENLFIGRINVWDRCNTKENYLILEEYEKTKNMLVWINPHSNNAYFFESKTPKLTFFVIWQGDLIRLFIFFLFLFVSKYINKHFKRELLKYGLTPKEYSKLSKEKKLDEYLKNYERQN